jgi:hypothetical protein
MALVVVTTCLHIKILFFFPFHISLHWCTCTQSCWMFVAQISTFFFLPSSTHVLALSLFLLYTYLLSPAELSWSEVFKQLCKLDSSCPVIEISSFLKAQLSRCLLPPFYLRTETDPVSETSCVLWKYRKMDKVQKPRNSVCYYNRFFEEFGYSSP